MYKIKDTHELRKKRLLIISFSYPIPIKREKIIHLAERFELWMVHGENIWYLYKNDPVHPVHTTTVGHTVLFSMQQNTARILMWLPVRAMRQFKPDITYIDAELWSPTLWYFLILKALGIVQSKVVVHCLTNKIIGGWKGIMRSFIYRMAGRQLTALIGSSSDITSLNQKLCKCPGLIYSTIPHIGPPEGIFYPRAKMDSKGKFVFGYIGRLAEEKGVKFLVLAYLSLPREIRAKTQLHIYGEGSESQTLAGMAGSEADVLLKGYVEPYIVPVKLREINVFVLPSVITKKDCEQWPIAVVEAMLSGIPVIATNVGGVPEMLNGFGKIVPERNVNILKETMMEVYKNYEGHYSYLAREAREFAVKNYSGQALAHKLSLFLESL